MTNLPDLGVPATENPRVVIVGGGFGGLQAARKLRNKNVQVVLIDKNNYHQFQPLFYQVAMCGIEPANIVFPLRKVFQKAKNIHLRTTTVLEVKDAENMLVTEAGSIHYDHLVLAMGAGNNFFGNKAMEENAVSMKSVSESLNLRNQVLQLLEDAANGNRKPDDLSICVIGGGPTGVELSGALAEMRKHVFPRDYPGIDFTKMRIVLMEGSNKLIAAMNEKSSQRALDYLKKLGVDVVTGAKVKTYSNQVLSLEDGSEHNFAMVIWAAGIKANPIAGIPAESILPNGRIKTNGQMQVVGTQNVYCIGDQAFVEDAAWPKGHPQVAQPAIQQGALFAKNLLGSQKGKPAINFTYKDLGSMATVGRNLAVAELKGLKLGGFFAWAIWMAVHLMSIVGVKNRLFIFINWLWSYITYDQSLRLLIKPYAKRGDSRMFND